MLQAIQQTSAWHKFQSSLEDRQGWELDGFFIYKLSFKKGWDFLYLPGLNKEPSPNTWQKIKTLAKTENCFFIHCEPYFDSQTKVTNKFIKSPLSYIEPYTRYLDLTVSEDDILSQMKSKGRYNIRLAQKKNLVITQEDTVDNFYTLLEQTTNRDGFSGNPKMYYQKMLDQLGSKHCKLWTAFHQNQPIASVIITFTEQTATYYYGASSNQHRNLMAPYLLHWEVIKFAKAANYKYYDLMGIAPPNQPKHSLVNVSQFKAKFGGNIYQFHHSFDIVLNLKYFLFYFYKLLKK